MAFFCFPAHADKLRVVASFSILGDMAQAVGGNAIEVKALVGPDGDAHVYEPSPADAQAVAQAKLIIVNGLGFEGWMERLVRAAGAQGKRVIASRGVTPLHTAEKAMIDPHAWQNIANGKVYAANIRDALMQADPAHAAIYQANAAHYLKQLDALEAWTKMQIGQMPSAQRKAIVLHNAFRYFAQAYGVEFIAPLGIAADSEPSAADMARLIDQIRTQHVRALFMENMSDPRLITQIESDSGVKAVGTLYDDALSRPGGPAASYIALFRHNVQALTQGMNFNK